MIFKLTRKQGVLTQRVNSISAVALGLLPDLCALCGLSVFSMIGGQKNDLNY